MAFHAGLHHVQTTDRGIRICMGQNIMGRMAAGTYRGHRQTLAVQTLAMDGHGKILQNILLGDIMGQGHGAAFLVTAAAGKGNIQYIGRRILIL